MSRFSAFAWSTLFWILGWRKHGLVTYSFGLLKRYLNLVLIFGALELATYGLALVSFFGLGVTLSWPIVF